jgi:outer membrane protein assembly factor BamB
MRAPARRVVANGQVIITQRVDLAGGAVNEGITRLESKKGEAQDRQPLAQGKAQYLQAGVGGNTGLATDQASALDSSVGFASAPAAANLANGAMQNAGVANVASGWAYNGSRAAYAGGKVLNAQGDALNCIGADSGEIRWRGLARGKDVGRNAQIFAPPALGTANMYLCSTRGHLLSVRQDDGQVGFVYHLRQPMAFQPALAGGAMYVGTNNGLLVCLQTGDKDADGGSAWGGNAQHNKKR